MALTSSMVHRSMFINKNNWASILRGSIPRRRLVSAYPKMEKSLSQILDVGSRNLVFIYIDESDSSLVHKRLEALFTNEVLEITLAASGELECSNNFLTALFSGPLKFF